MVFKRPVTSIERLYLTGKHVFSDVVIQVIIEGEGFIDTSELKKALVKVNNLLPGTRLRLHKKYWIGDGEPTKVINLTEYPDTREQLSRFVNMHGSFQPELGHTVEVELAKKDNRTLIIFRAIHGVMDARGLEFWIQAVFAALRNEDIPRVDSTMTDDALLRKMRAPVRKDEPFIPRSTGPVCRADADTAGNYSFEYARLTLKKSIPAIVPKIGIGIQKLLMNDKGDRGTIMVPVDLRQDIPGDDSRSTANLSFPLFLTLKMGQTWSELLNLMLSKLQERKYLARSRNNIGYRLFPLSMFVPLVRSLWKSQIKKGKYLVSAVVSHVGRHNFRDYSCPGFRADSILFVPCIMPVAPLSVAITESDTTTDIVLVQGKTLFSGPRDTLEKLITLAELDHLVLRDSPLSPAASLAQPLISAYQPQPPVIFKEAHLGLHELFERHIAVNSDKPCLVYGDEVLTYSEVNSRANRLAHLLLSLDLKKGDFAGVMLERSFDGIISILAIMKAAGVYVPLDPTLPENRLEYLITDSKPAFIIAMSTQVIPYSDGVKIIHIDKLQDEIGKFSDLNPNLPVSPGDRCYMIYTSGSTGQPKGAMNTHGALTNNFLWMQSTFSLNADDATLQKTPFNFDASILETFLALQCGAKIVIAKPEGHKDTSYLLEEIRKHSITFIFSVPSVLNIMLDEIEEQKNTSLRLILVGGEQFSMHLYEKLRSRFHGVSVYNLYGPAEAAIEVTTFDCCREFSGESVPIGKPIANIETFVVDENMNPVEQGASGELIIYGIGIGTGYFGKEELTAEKFIDHPLKQNSEYKAYRTGDIVRELADGNLVFLGRKDNQIKIGGVRIETGEIEHHLQSIPWVNQAVVTGKAVSSSQSDSQITLVAYYSASESDESDQGKYIRTYLRDRLPGYMVPSAIIRIDSFPLNPSGKIDRLNLPDPAAWITGEAESRDSWSDIEKQLADIWASVLCTPPNRNCNFFDMGGNSILAITLVEKINKHFQCSLHAKMIYENPDFSDIVKILQTI